MTSRILILMLCIMLLLTSWCQASSQVDVFFDGLNKAINFMVASIGLLAQNPPRDVQVIKSRSYILSSSFVLWIPSDFNQSQRRVCSEIESTCRRGFWEVYLAAQQVEAGNKDAAADHMEKVLEKVRHITRLVSDLK